MTVVMMIVIVVMIFAVIMMMVVAMPMVMAVIVFVIVGMIVMVTVSVVVLVIMVMVVRFTGRRRVGSAFRLERRLDRDDLGAKPLQQCLDRRVRPQPQPLFQDLHRHVAVAEVPGKPRQRREIDRPCLNERLGLGHHLDQAAVVEHQRIVGAKPHRLRKVKLDAGALGAEQKALLRLALRKRQDQRIDDCAAFAIGRRENAGGARHG